MYRVTLLQSNEYLTELHTSVYAARRSAIEHFAAELLAEPGGARTLFRMGGKMTWKHVEPKVLIGLVTGEWITIVEGDEVPDTDMEMEMDNVIFVEKKSQMRHLGHWDAEAGHFVDGSTDRTYKPAKISSYLILPDEVEEADTDAALEDLDREPTEAELASMESLFDKAPSDDDED